MAAGEGHVAADIAYGVMRFPLGSDQCDRVVFTTMGLKGHGETVMIEK